MARPGLLVPPRAAARRWPPRSARCSTIPRAARAMGRAGRRRVEEQFSWASVAARTETLYADAIEDVRAGGGRSVPAPTCHLRGFVFDLDGCVWNGAVLDPGAREALRRSTRSGRALGFLSNNSRATGEDLRAGCTASASTSPSTC